MQKLRWGPEVTPVLSDEVSQAIRMETVRSIKLLRKNGVEVGGLLTVSPAGYAEMRVDGFEVVPCEHLYGPSYRLSRLDREILRTQAARIQASGAKIVGYFRTCTREELTVTPEDAAVVQELLPDAQFILVAKASPLSNSISRLFWPGGDGQWSKHQEFELPKRAIARVRGLPKTSEVLAVSAPSTLPVPMQTRLALPARAHQNRFKVVYYPMAVALLLLSIAFVAWDRLQPKMTTSAADLGLSVDVQGSDLHVTWNRNIPAVRFAKSGKLRINDNGQQQDVVMDARQVANGSVLYTPTSGNVSFRMDVQGKDAQLATGGFRVFNLIKAAETAEKLAPVAIPEAPIDTHASASRANIQPTREGLRSNSKRARTSKVWEPPIVETPRAPLSEQPEGLEAPPALAMDIQPDGLPSSFVELPTPPVKSAAPQRRITAKVFRAVTKFFTPKE
jgi:hypothetical protein